MVRASWSQVWRFCPEEERGERRTVRCKEQPQLSRGGAKSFSGARWFRTGLFCMEIRHGKSRFVVAGELDRLLRPAARDLESASQQAAIVQRSTISEWSSWPSSYQVREVPDHQITRSPSRSNGVPSPSDLWLLGADLGLPWLQMLRYYTEKMTVVHRSARSVIRCMLLRKRPKKAPKEGS